MLVNCNERKKPPVSRMAIIAANGMPGTKDRAGGEKSAADQAVVEQHVAVAEALEHARGGGLHEHRAERAGKGDEPRLKRRQAESELQQQRQQERHRADAEPEHEAAENAGAEGRQFEQREIEDRRRRAPGMNDIGRRRNGADADQRGNDADRQERQPHDRQPEREAADRRARKG